MNQGQPRTAAQEMALDCEADMLFFGGSAGSLKGFSLDTPIPVPSGWKAMGEMRVGDELFDDAGEICRVTGISETYTDKPLFDVHFDDGTVVRSTFDHLWWTFTERERLRLLRTTPQWRSARRLRRPSRSKGKKPWLAARNSALAALYEPPPVRGAIRTTEQIAQSLYVKNGTRRNHSVETCKPIRCAPAGLPIDPYVLGVWLGDGSTGCAMITTADPEILAELESAGHKVTKYADKYSWGVNDLHRRLRLNGLLGHKHIPAAYLRASFEQRLALLQGLMDTDGTANSSKGNVFYSTDHGLIQQVQELVRSLGIKGNITTWRAKLNGKDCGPAYGICFITRLPVFRLSRKLKAMKLAVRDTTHRRYITRVEPAPLEPSRCIAVSSPSKLYLVSRSFIPTHNTHTMLLDAIQERKKPSFRGIIFRQSFPQLSDIIDKSHQIYKPLGAEYNETKKRWTFPGGAELKLGFLENDRDVYNYWGGGYSFLGFDESTFHTEFQIRTLLSRLRSTDRSLRVRVRLASNPGGIGASWHQKVFLRGACPVHHPGKCAVPGQIYKDAVWPSDGTPIPMSVAFIPGKLSDHNLLGEEYAATLKSQSGALASQLLDGCWCQLEGAYFDFLNKESFVPYAMLNEQWWYSHFISLDYGYGKSSAAAGLFYRGPATREFPDGQIVQVGEVCVPHTAAYEFARMVVEQFIQPRFQGQRRKIVACYLDPSNFKDIGDGHTIADQIAEILSPYDVIPQPASNDRIGGWQLVYRLLRSKEFVIADTCPRTFDALRTRVHDDKKPGDIRKVPGDPGDDLCFVPGTMIATDRGWIPIELISSGDKVITRQGLRAVVAAGRTAVSAETVELMCSDGTVLCGSPNHPVFVEDSGFIRMDGLRYGDRLVVCNRDTTVHVVSVRTGKRSSLYNITVDDCHEYFANGVLVHNCDQGRYALYSFINASEKPKGVRLAEAVEGLDVTSASIRHSILQDELDQEDRPMVFGISPRKQMMLARLKGR